MSVMIVSSNAVKATAKILWLYESSKEKEGFLNLDVLNKYVEQIATLNCMSYSDRYDEDVEVEYEAFTDYPDIEVVPQDLVSAQSWCYQIEGDTLNDVTYKTVSEAIKWVEEKYHFTKEQMKKCVWG